jgi:PAS domain S-box-containing protein
MADEDKTKEQLIAELKELRQQVIELQANEREYKRTKEALLQSEELYRSAVEGSIQGIAIHQESIIQFANQAFAEMFGYSSPDELVGKNLHETLIEPEEWPDLNSRADALLSGKSIPVHQGWRGICKDGTRILVQSSASLISWRNKTAILGFFIDDTERMRSEEKLRESEERYRTAIEHSNDGVAIFRQEKFLYVNQRFVELFGYDRQEDLVDNPGSIVVHPDDRPRVIEFYRLRQEGKPVSPRYEFKGIRKDGESIDIEIYATTMTYSGESVSLAYLRDVTERKQRERALRERQEFIQTIMDNMPIGLAVHNTDDGKFQYMNKRFEEYYGQSREVLIDIDAFWANVYIDPEFRKKFSKKVQKDVSSEDPKRMHWEDVPITNEKGDVRFVSATNIPLPSLNLMISTVWDVTEGKRAEEALRESEKKYRTLFEDSGDAIYINTKEGKFLDLNRSMLDLFGYSKKEMTETSVIEIYANPDDRVVATRKLDQKGFVRDYEVKFKKKDGTEIECLLTATVRRADNGSVLGYQGIIRDISEKRRMEVKLQEAQKLESIGTLAGGIAHDFNNLLMGIQGYTSLMLLDINSGHPHYEKLMAIEQQVQSGAKLTRQLLGYARKGRYEVRPINLNQLVKEIAGTFGRTRKEIAIHQELAEKQFLIEADQGQIEQVLLNLFVNAADAMPGGGVLKLRITNVSHNDMMGKLYNPKPGNYAMLTVKDTGMGMDSKTQSRIFEPFFTTKEMGRGTGLGLASAYGIIKAHGGYIEVDSEKGHGTTFSIYLPASKDKAPKEKTFSGEILKGIETILFVDDEEHILDVGVQFLKSMGYTILAGRSGKEAIEVYAKNKDKIDMVILDMIMPDVGGGETYDNLKKINPNIKVLLSSGYSIDGQATTILERGCDGFIQKPFNIRDLSQKIREILDSQLMT